MRPRPEGSLLRRLGWMAAIWGLSVAALGIVAWLIRSILL